MVQQLSRLALLGAVVVSAGCGSNEPTPVGDSPTTKAAVEQSASQAWTTEKQEAYRNAMQRARSGQEGKGITPANPMNGGGMPVGNPDDPDAGPSAPTYTPPTSQPAASTPQPTAKGRPQNDDSGADPMVGK